MTLSGLVKQKASFLNESEIQHYQLADIFTIGYRGTLIGYYDPQHHNLTLDGHAVNAFKGSERC